LYELDNKLGNTDSSLNLGLMHLSVRILTQGLYIEVDREKATTLLKGAAQRGNVRAKEYLLTYNMVSNYGDLEKESIDDDLNNRDASLEKKGETLQELSV
jgi:TPR repeat protein